MTEEEKNAVRARLPRFPLQPSKGLVGPASCSWQTAEMAYSEYRRRYGNDQCLERLAERGGFSLWEMDDQFPGWRAREDELLVLRKLVLAADGLLAAMGTKDHPIEAWHAAQFEELEMRAADYWGQFPKEGE